MYATSALSPKLGIYPTFVRNVLAALSVLFCGVASASTPRIDWSTFVGTDLEDSSSDVAVDRFGNIFVAGTTRSASFPVGGTEQPTSYGGGVRDCYVMKLSPDGKLVWSRFLGGSKDETAITLITNASGETTLAGYTESPDFPTANGHSDELSGQKDIFVTRFDSSGTIVWSTYLGGRREEYCSGLSADADGNFFVVGHTISTDFPAFGSYSNELTGGSGSDGIVTKFSPDGRIIWSTYLGGTGGDACYDVSVAHSGRVTVSGQTWAKDFPMLNAYDATHNGGNQDGFVCSLSNEGQLMWSTYLGGGRSDGGHNVISLEDGTVWIVGSTRSEDFPIVDGSDRVLNDGNSILNDLFLARFDQQGSLIWSSYLGGEKTDSPYDTYADQHGDFVIIGRTASSDFPGVGAPYAIKGIEDFFISKISGSGLVLWSTIIGGSEIDSGEGIAIDDSDDVVVCGYTASRDFPIVRAFSANLRGDEYVHDGFVIRLFPQPRANDLDFNGDGIVDSIDLMSFSLQWDKPSLNSE